MFKRSALTTFTALVAASAGPNAASGDQLKVIANGSSIKCYVNGALIIDTTDASYTGTSHGAWAYSSTAAVFSAWEHNSLTS